MNACSALPGLIRHCRGFGVVALALMLSSPAEAQEKATILGHLGPITSLGISPDGKLLASASTDGTARIWDLQTQRQLDTLKVSDPSMLVPSVSFSPDGKWIATGSYQRSGKEVQGLVTVWDAATRKEATRYRGGALLAFSPDGKALAVGNLGDKGNKQIDPDVWLLEPATGKKLAVLVGHQRQTTAIAFSSDNRFLATASSDGTILLWDLRKGPEKPIGTMREGDLEVTALTFSPDSKRLASIAPRDGNLVFWDVPQATQLSKQFAGRSPFLRYSPDSHVVIIGSGRDLVFFDFNLKKRKIILEGHRGDIRAIALSPNGRLIATGASDKTIKIWEMPKTD